jgi:hypothetical protein
MFKWTMSRWKKAYNEEDRLYDQYSEWYRRETQLRREASDRGDYKAADRHQENALRFFGMATGSIERQYAILEAARHRRWVILLRPITSVVDRWLSKWFD